MSPIKRALSLLRFPVVALGLLLAGEALTAQPPNPADVMTLACLGLQYLGDCDLQEDLGLTAEQVKQVDELRTKWAKNFTRGGVAKKDGDTKIADYNAALAKILGAEAYIRLGQIAMQQSVRQFGEMRAVRYPFVVQVLDLTADQVVELRFDEPLAQVITAAQKQKWHAILGEEYTADLKTDWPTVTVKAETKKKSIAPTPKPLIPPSGSPMRLLAEVRVQRDLKLTEKQFDALRSLHNEMAAKEKEIRSVAPQLFNDPKLVELRAAVDQKAIDLLQADQHKRLIQIQHQMALDGKSLLTFFGAADNAKILGLTAEQIAKFPALSGERAEALEKLFVQAKDYERLVKDLSEFHWQQQQKFQAFLNKEQLAKFEAYIGEPFDIDIIRPGGTMIASSLRPNGFAGATTGKASPVPAKPLTFAYLESHAVRQEVKLTDPQVAGVKKLFVEWLTAQGDAEKQIPLNEAKALNLKTDDALDKLLQPEQSKRLWQLILQRSYKGAEVDAVLTVNAAAAELKITPEQTKKLRLARFEHQRFQSLVEKQDWGVKGTAIPRTRINKALTHAWHDNAMAVLTPEQQKKYRTLGGEPFTGRIHAENAGSLMQLASGGSVPLRVLGGFGFQTPTADVFAPPE